MKGTAPDSVGELALNPKILDFGRESLKGFRAGFRSLEEAGRRLGGGWEEAGRRPGGGWEEARRRPGGGWEEAGQREPGGDLDRRRLHREILEGEPRHAHVPLVADEGKGHKGGRSHRSHRSHKGGRGHRQMFKGAGRSHGLGR